MTTKKEIFKKIDKNVDKVVNKMNATGKLIREVSSSAIKKGKPPQKASNYFLKYANAFGNQSQQQGRVQSGPGRPKGVMKWRSPFTGKPIPATLYYKEVRAYRRFQAQKAEQAQAQQLQQMAKRGITPQQAAMIQMRQQQMVQQNNIQQMQPQVQMQNQNIQSRVPPQQVQTSVRPIWRRQNVIRTERDAFGNVKEIQSGNDPRNFWN